MEITWRQRIEAARSRGSFTEDDREDADLWGCCAVGEMVDLNPALEKDTIDVIAEDEDLHSLGMDFTHAVLSDNIDWASRVHEKIRTHPTLAIKENRG